MPLAWKADVVVVAREGTATTERCLRSVLAHGGSALHRLVVVAPAPASADATISDTLDAIAAEDPRLRVIQRPAALSEVEAINLALEAREADAVLLRGDMEATPGWLKELARASHSGARIACACALSDQDGYGSLPLREAPEAAAPCDPSAVREAAAHLPRWTLVPIPGPACCYLRGDVLQAVGVLDPAFRTVEAALADWALRAQALGFLARRANHAFVRRLGASRDGCEEDREALAGRHPHLGAELDAFRPSLERTVEYHAVATALSGKLRVAYDLRALPREHVGTRTYAVSLARALAQEPGIDLTLLVKEPSQAAGLSGRVVAEGDWEDDAAVIHRPAQIIDTRELQLLYNSSAHLIVTYQDLIGYRIPLVFGGDAEHRTYRATSCLALQGVQRVLAYSECAAREIVEEFGVPREEVAVVPLGVDASWFAHRGPGDDALRRTLKLPPRYFFSVATDFPHKNLPALLEAYALLRGRWRRGAPPALVLAGYATGARSGFYQRLRINAREDGVVFLGPVSSDQLRVLYQGAEALVFPSLYEGFGLPPLEAMAAGAPVVAMPISSVPEVGGDAVCYADDLSAEALARAMVRLATDESLRDRFRGRGAARAEEFRWERTARETIRVYRDAVRRPSARSLEMRRRLRDAILNWSESGVPSRDGSGTTAHRPVFAAQQPGIRTAWRALNGAVHRRLLREVRRLKPASRRRTA